MDDFYNETSSPVVVQAPSLPTLHSAAPCPSSLPAAAGGRGRSDGPTSSVNATACGKPRLDSQGNEEFHKSGNLSFTETAGPLTVSSRATEPGEVSGSRTIRAGAGHARPKLQGVIGGKLDGSAGNALGGQKRAQFAVSQLHGVLLSLQQALLSKAVPWRDFLHVPSFQKPQTGAMAVDRIERNLRYFYMNYVVICGALTLLAALLNPVILVVAGLCAGASAFAGLKGDTLRLGDTLVPVKTFRLGCLVVAALTILLVAGHVMMSLLLGCALLVLLHACMHVGVSYEQIAQRTAGDADFDV